MIDVIMVDLISSKNPVLAATGLEGELAFALQAISVLCSHSSSSQHADFRLSKPSACLAMGGVNGKGDTCSKRQASK